MVQFQYSPLVNQDEIRVIQLLSKDDYPCHAAGPIRCRIDHVLLNNPHFATENTCPAKGLQGAWSNPLVLNIAAQPQGRDGRVSKMLWKKSLAERISGKIHSSGDPQPPSSSNRAEFEYHTDCDRDVQVEEVAVPWRYTWGDFVALSYVWGDPTVRCEIYIGESSVLVPVNLEAALRQLRNNNRIQQGFRIWIDALCINRTDLIERVAQVLRMKDIYARAWRVVVWLGPKAKNSDLAMMAVQFLSIQSQEKEPLHVIYLRFDRYIIRIPCLQWKHTHTRIRMRQTVLWAIYHLLTRTYWRRLWIIQEIALAARQSPVLCGNSLCEDSCILLDDVYNALQVIQRDGAVFGRYFIYSVKSRGTARRG